jgi:hypothetical protein
VKILNFSNRCQPNIEFLDRQHCITGILVEHANNLRAVYIGFIPNLRAQDYQPTTQQLRTIAQVGRKAPYTEARLYFPTLVESEYAH